MKCAERGCPWPAMRDGLCPHCWQRVHGLHVERPVTTPIVEAQELLAFTAQSSEQGKAVGNWRTQAARKPL